MENSQNVHDDNQFVRQPEAVENESARRLGCVDVDNADTHHQ